MLRAALLEQRAFRTEQLAGIRRREGQRGAAQDEVQDHLAAAARGPVGERGVRLSGGQRQRLGIARAIYKAAPVFVLDEATSALDEATEAAVVAALDKLRSEGRTIIIVAHRQSTIRHCDLVVELDHGRTVSCRGRADADQES